MYNSRFPEFIQMTNLLRNFIYFGCFFFSDESHCSKCSLEIMYFYYKNDSYLEIMYFY